jgi:2-oxoglutarate ferredoxin oxidoreductase subunit alpha
VKTVAKELWKGDYAYGECAIRAGCRLFAGYPITPTTELMEYIATHLPKAGGQFIQAENEANIPYILNGAAACGTYAFTTSSAPGTTLMQEGIAWASKYDTPAVLLHSQRYGGATGTLHGEGQTDYKRDVAGGGHGDYHTIVFAPASVQECVNLLYISWELAYKYRVWVVIHVGRSLCHMYEAIELPPAKDPPPRPSWCLNGKKHTAKDPFDPLCELLDDDAAYVKAQQERYGSIVKNEQRWDAGYLEDAEYVIVTYGMPGRVVRKAVGDMRQSGEKVGYIRPVTIWPYPRKAFDMANKDIKGFLCMEVNDLGQMKNDVALSAKVSIRDRNIPVYAYYQGHYFNVDEVKSFYSQVKNGQVAAEL